MVALETCIQVDQAQTLKGKTHKQMAMKSSKATQVRQGFFSPKFTPEGAMSPLWKDSRDGAQEPLCSSPKGEITSQAQGHLL